MEVVRTICELSRQHHAWRRSCLNLVAAENVTSPLVESFLASDFSRRYSSERHGGDKYFVRIQEIVAELAKSLFRVSYAELRPISGNMAVLACLTGLVRPGDTILTVDPAHGGYPIRIADWAGITTVYHPFDAEQMNIRTEEAAKTVLSLRPALVVFGASEFLFPHPVESLAEACHEVGAAVFYDGSHVMGLVAGAQFQDPLSEGADVLGGSTHKTLAGPQRGIILTNDERIYQRIAGVLDRPPFLQTSYHANSLVALGIALAECLRFGQQFAAQIVRNAHALALALHNEGVPVLAAQYGYTKSHQVILATDGFSSPRGLATKEKLETCGIIADTVVRLGVQEVTRLGMLEGQMRQVASLIADVVQNRRPAAEIRRNVAALVANYQNIRFSFQDGEEAYAFISCQELRQLS